MISALRFRKPATPPFAAIGVALLLAAGPAWAAGNELLKTDCYAKPNDPACQDKAASPAPTTSGAPLATPLAGGRLKGSNMPPSTSTMTTPGTASPAEQPGRLKDRE